MRARVGLDRRLVRSVRSASRFELEGEPRFDLSRAPCCTVWFEAPVHQSVFNALLLSPKCTDDVDVLDTAVSSNNDAHRHFDELRPRGNRFDLPSNRLRRRIIFDTVRSRPVLIKREAVKARGELPQTPSIRAGESEDHDMAPYVGGEHHARQRDAQQVDCEKGMPGDGSRSSDRGWILRRKKKRFAPGCASSRRRPQLEAWQRKCPVRRSGLSHARPGAALACRARNSRRRTGAAAVGPPSNRAAADSAARNMY